RLMDNAAAQARRIRAAVAGSFITAVRGEGLLLGLVAGKHAAPLKKYLQQQAILVGGASDPAVLRLMPPLNVSTESVSTLLEAIRRYATEQQLP
ncbi:MAG TPA: hypothetical protein VGS99_00260, partial [Gammaproteobacteria bacterium]|nr:hypothetical protein [Gammaproteobacteria bacterium]